MNIQSPITWCKARVAQTAFAASSVAVIAFIIFTMALPLRLWASSSELSDTSSIQAPSASATTLTPTASASSKAASTPPASGVFTNSNPAFAQDPTWGINFANQPNGALNPNLLHFDLGNVGYGSNQLEDYTNSPANARVENGALLIQALQQSKDGSPYTSARLTTQGIKDFAYGKLNIVAEEPVGNGTWPSIWLISAHQPYANNPTLNGLSPYLNSGEIDIAESIGAQPGKVYSVLQAEKSNYFEPNEHYNVVNVPDDTTTFHDYGIEWTPTSISFTLDGVVTYTLNKDASWDYKTWPYTAQNPFDLVINLAVGGWGGAVNNASLPATLQIKSITYWPYVGN